MAFLTRFKELEDAIVLLSNEIANIKLSVAKINARHAVSTRDKLKNVTFDDVFADLMGGGKRVVVGGVADNLASALGDRRNRGRDNPVSSGGFDRRDVTGDDGQRLDNTTTPSDGKV